MNTFGIYSKDFLLEIGRVVLFRSELRSKLLSAIDALLCIRPGEKSVTWAMMNGRELPEICQALHTFSQVRGIAPETVKQYSQIVAEYHTDFESAASFANGRWTYLGGMEPHYGLFLGDSENAENPMLQWRSITVEDLRQLVKRLESALEALEPILWAARLNFADRMQAMQVNTAQESTVTAVEKEEVISESEQKST